MTLTEAEMEAKYDSVMVMRPDGTQMRELSAMDIDYMGSWSPDGRHISYAALVEQRGPARSRILNIDGSGYSEFPFRGGACAGLLGNRPPASR